MTNGKLRNEEIDFFPEVSDNYSNLAKAHAAENAKPLNAIEFEKGLRKRYAQKDEEYDSMLGIVEYIRVDFSSSFLREGGKTLDAITLV
ncbi:hypothetical protein Bca52824_031974 [Brassica carinata]|uniref:Uncharacterized protein n=1 Tax=Brassica carinata TaxID=52824 RepID=A0A8X7S937_BRACI|nr:hypothetical protein Bca52824_031974 [Brassica carinata]